MAGLILPNVVNTLAPLMQLEQNDRRNALVERAYAREEEDRAREREVAGYVPSALAGDKEALGKVASISPKTAFALAPLLERADTATRTRAKEAAAWTQQAALGVLSVPPEQRPSAYAAALADGKARGYDTSTLPQQYGPDVEGRLNFYVGQARNVDKWFEENANRPTPIGPAPGGAPPAGAPGDMLVRTKAAIARNESAGQPNGGYGAVGPDTGKGRAYGKYQVMDFNIGPWTQEALGKPMTPQEFLANPQAQEAVADHKLGQYIKQYGSPEAAARAWFAGPGGMNNANAKDVLGTTVGGYGQKFAQAYGAGATQVAGAPAGLPQGGAVRADANGNALPPDQNAQLRAMQLPQGARFIGIKGVPITKDGAAFVQLADGTQTWLPLPERKAPKEQTGPFAGTSTEAQALNMLITNGTLTHQQAAELAAGKTITNPADGSVMFMTPSGLFRQAPGGTPAPAAPSAPATAPPAAGAPPAAPATPPGMIPVTPPKPQGMTEGQANAALYADRMKASEKIIAANESAGLDPTGKVLEGVPMGNYLQSGNYQKLEQARRDFINAVLRRESGAVISDQEFTNAEKQYFPRPGDKPDTLKQKAENRRLAIEGISRAAGPTYAKEAPKPAPQGADRERTLFDARAAIRQGAPREAVIERLRSMGIDPEGL